MADPRFFKTSDPITLAELAERAGADIPADADGGLVLRDVQALSEAESDHVSFLDNAKYKNDFFSTKAGACFVSEDMAALAPEGCIPLVSKSPYKSYALAAQYFYSQELPRAEISDGAHVHPTASIGEGVQVEAGAVIAAGVRIGDGSWIRAGAVIGENVEIGQHCRIGVNAVVSHAVLGDYVRLYRGVCVGQDGFGFAIDPAGHVKVPQLGRVMIGNHVEVGANTTIDRGAGPDTIIGDGCWIDNLVQIGHNVKLGRGCVIVSQVGISGSTELGDFVVAAGQVGIAGHLKIGTGARIAAKSGVMKSIPAGEDYMGYPAVPRKKYLRQVATLSRLIKPKK